MYKLAAIFIASATVFALTVALGWSTITKVVPASTIYGLCLMVTIIYIPAMVATLTWQARQDKAASLAQDSTLEQVR